MQQLKENPVVHLMSERLLLAQKQQQRIGLAEIVGTIPEQKALAEVVRYCTWQIVVPPQTEPGVSYLYATLFNLQAEVSFWLDRRMVLWQSEMAEQILHDLFS
jgi:hypothetical protein